ncbi:hypothetical protein DUNSADRAFT_10171 [Dunaliella salina]|uniref:Uncharacterized protein n=1 Tax=Dunaliella salina TaxID=3046 RepID=A0ABQ7GG05_DUNSA|nr:hypothetical protein DUNSADRAFT_10171 [Dunaliella salina]|eukprot:KAF5833521.1 hypothetical protein DUNSADRAFT_10171 [Dunaliella salina]
MGKIEKGNECSNEWGDEATNAARTPRVMPWITIISIIINIISISISIIISIATNIGHAMHYHHHHRHHHHYHQHQHHQHQHHQLCHVLSSSPPPPSSSSLVPCINIITIIITTATTTTIIIIIIISSSSSSSITIIIIIIRRALHHQPSSLIVQVVHHCSSSHAMIEAPLSYTFWDLIAAAHGSTVDIFSLQASRTNGALQAELHSSLAHDAEVWKVEWNMLGTCLGTATVSNRISVWRPNFVGEFSIVSAIQGCSKVAVEGSEAEGMEEGGEVD